MSYRQNGQRFGRNFSSRPRSFQPKRVKPSGIHPSKYVQAASPVQPSQSQPERVLQHTFAEFGLDQSIVQNVKAHGYTDPTPIQDQVIPVLMDGKDVVGIANTGTGKTAAFLLPLIHQAITNPRLKVLIVAPTRELAVQIQDEFIAFTRGLRVRSCVCIGGASINWQIKQLQMRPQFLIGTPGRIKDLIERRAVNLSEYSAVVLDEVDRMLDIGFRREIELLLSQLPSQRLSAFFSATMDRDTEGIMQRFLHNPVKISVAVQQTGQHIHQDIVRVDGSSTKVEVLHSLLIQEEFSRVIVFGRTKHGINKLEKQLMERGLQVCAIHGNKTQAARQRALEMFKKGRAQALLATDIAARGIDIDGVTHVINYDEPQTYEDYVHRIGRTGRAGKQGKALTFVS